MFYWGAPKAPVMVGTAWNTCTKKRLFYFNVVPLYSGANIQLSSLNHIKKKTKIPLTPRKQKQFSFSEEHLLCSNIWISINNPRFPLHKDINNCYALKPPPASLPLWEESGRGGAGGGVCNGTRVGVEVGQGRAGCWAPTSRWKSAMWTGDPAWRGHGLERVIRGWGMPPSPWPETWDWCLQWEPTTKLLGTGGFPPVPALHFFNIIFLRGWGSGGGANIFWKFFLLFIGWEVGLFGVFVEHSISR